MKKHIAPFIKLLLLLAFLSRLEFVFGQDENATIATVAATVRQHQSKGSVKSADNSPRRATTLGEEIGVERLELKASPNAFNSRTDLSFTLRNDGSYKLEMLNMQGDVLTVLAEGTGQAGEHFVYQLKKDGFAAGAYIARLITQHEVTSARFMLK